VTIPALEVLVLKASKGITETRTSIGSLKLSEDFLTGFFSINAQVKSRDLLVSEFFVKKGKKWQSLGIDTSTPFNYFLNPKDFPKRLTVKAKITDSKGRVYEFKPLTFTPASS